MTFVSCILCGTVAAQPPPAPVAVSPVVQRDVQRGQVFVATVMPWRHSVVASELEGIVVEVLVREGDAVKQGDVLARLRTVTLEIQLAVEAARLRERMEEWQELKIGYRQELIDKAKGTYEAARAAARAAELTLKRTQELFERGVAPPEELEVLQATFDAARQTEIGAKADYDRMVNGPTKEEIARTKARVDEQHETIRLWQDKLGQCTIRAPFAGHVVKQSVEVGEWAKEGDAIVELIELNPVEVVAQVPEHYISQLQPTVSARVEIPDGPRQVLTGEVTHVVPQADVKSRSFPVKVRLDNPTVDGQPLLKSGLFARVTLPLGQVEQALLVPKDALVLGGPSPLVYVVHENQVRPVTVQLGIADGSLIQVFGELEPGQQVVTQGNERLHPGQTVRLTGIEN